MTDRPIIFSAPMVRGLIREVERPGTGKTETRRIIKPRPWNANGDTVNIDIAKSAEYVKGADGRYYYSFEHPLGGPLTAYVSRFDVGDRLWVRENWALLPRSCYALPKTISTADPDMAAYYFADFDRSGKPRWRPSIHMPRWASRLTLTVSAVKVDRLQDISEADALAEGVKEGPGGWFSAAEGQASPTARGAFALLWNSINGPDAWTANPWVVAVGFTPELRNIDVPRPALDPSPLSLRA